MHGAVHIIHVVVDVIVALWPLLLFGRLTLEGGGYGSPWPS